MPDGCVRRVARLPVMMSYDSALPTVFKLNGDEMKNSTTTIVRNPAFSGSEFNCRFSV